VLVTATSPASAAAPHLVQPGESLWSISAANGLSMESVAAFNGISPETYVIAGETIQVPASWEVDVSATAPAAAAAPVAVDAYGLATVSGPMGSVQLDAGAATAFEAMRADSLAQFGIDLYPDGTLSGYRTYEQQAYLYDLFLQGIGAPANPPGTSAHELGIAIDLSDPAMRSAVDQLGGAYGWYGIDSEWWHIEYGG
jgi:LAS superfamily LD-carboxypeptidase LdcB